ncbi:MAG: 2-isopropylmalate synthase [Alphaproteobacteria bacterium]|nr:2-isopropylmalate synthase [Alphaproteobacteria bacterium]
MTQPTQGSAASSSTASAILSKIAGAGLNDQLGLAPSERVVIFDTTLRDGEQSPGASMNLEEKCRIALALEEMGVDVIEAGFPISSNGDFEAVQQIAGLVKTSSVCGLSRAKPADIDRAGEALRKAVQPRIHTFISTSPLHMKYKLQMEPDAVLEAITASVTRARNLVSDVEWSAEDGSRTDPDFLCRAVELAIKAGATTINIPDTVGYAVPEEYAALISLLIERVPNIDLARLSVHCHNDLGLAVANSLAAVKAGARQIECTINGLGERAGNAALEEIVMALRTRGDYYGYQNRVVTENITRISHLVSTVTGFAVQPNKAIVGANAFAHESGIHQDGMLKHKGTYEIMSPESVGLTRSNIVLGKLSGRHAFSERLMELGFELGDNALNDAFVRFKALADSKRQIFDEDLIALIGEQSRSQAAIRFVSLQVTCGSIGPQQAVLDIELNGLSHKVVATGNGPVDAIFNGIKQVVPHEARLQLYQVHAVTAGTDAQAEVTVRLEEEGRTVIGQGAHPDTLVASAKAYIHALNKLLLKRLKTAPDEMRA